MAVVAGAQSDTTTDHVQSYGTPQSAGNASKNEHEPVTVDRQTQQAVEGGSEDPTSSSEPPSGTAIPTEHSRPPATEAASNTSHVEAEVDSKSVLHVQGHPGESAVAAETVTPIGNNDEDQTWPLKSVFWPPFSEHPMEVKILMQDMNGPCSFLALCNVLLLRGDITLPLHHRSVSFSHLSSLVADYLLRTSSALPSSPSLASNESALDFALSILPKTLSGLDVNVNFVDGTFSRPEGTLPGELELFQLAGVDIRHGWLASEEDSETWAVLSATALDYDTAVNRLVEGDEIAGGAITDSSSTGDTAKLERLFEDLSMEPEKQAKVYQASLIRRFLDTTSTQLTYAGLFKLSESLRPGSLCALFRNSHFSVLFRRPDAVPTSSLATFSFPHLPPATLFHLVTDSALLHEPSAVWESLEDVDGANSRFYDSSLQPARIRRDWVSRQSRSTEERREMEGREDADVVLAMQMQQDEYDRDAYHRRQERQQQVDTVADGESGQRQQNVRLGERKTEEGGRKPAQMDPKQWAGQGVAKEPQGTKEKPVKKEKKDCVVS